MPSGVLYLHPDLLVLRRLYGVRLGQEFSQWRIHLFRARAHKASLSRYNARSKTLERPVQDHHLLYPSNLVYKHHPLSSRVSVFIGCRHHLCRLTISPTPSPFLPPHARNPTKAEPRPNTSPSTFSVHGCKAEPRTDLPNIPWNHVVRPLVPQRNQPSQRTT
jgi:hypothetical protein